MPIYSADFVFPVSGPPIPNGAVEVTPDGKIISVGLASAYPSEKTIAKKGWLIPGLINAHSHLELSYLKNKIKPGYGLNEFIRELEEQKKDVSESVQRKAMDEAEKEMIEAGIVVVGDIANTPLSIEQKKSGRLTYHTFIELFGFNPIIAQKAFGKWSALLNEFRNQGLTASLAPHAPYSVSDPLFLMINEFNGIDHGLASIHLGETPDEKEMFFTGSGKIMDRLAAFGINTTHWEAPEVLPVEWIMQAMNACPKILLVHNTFLDTDDLNFLTSLTGNPKPYFCLCPGANLFIENTLPNVVALMKTGIPICLGTDSLASNHRLSIWDELKTLSTHFPSIPFSDLLQWSTYNGATFLNLSDTFGTLEPGKTPGLNLIVNPGNNISKINLDSTIERIDFSGITSN